MFAQNQLFEENRTFIQKGAKDSGLEIEKVQNSRIPCKLTVTCSFVKCYPPKSCDDFKESVTEAVCMYLGAGVDWSIDW